MLPVLHRWIPCSAEEIDVFRSRGDILHLIHLLGNRHPDVQVRAADALKTIGPAATGALVCSLVDSHLFVKLGALEVLAGIRDPSCVEAVIDTLAHDPDPEVKWAAASALGEIGDGRGVPHLVTTLSHPDKFIRFGSALSLKKCGWDPATAEQTAALLFGLQDWTGLRKIGRPAVLLLIHALSDHDRDVRDHAVDLLAETGGPETREACNRALSDADGAVRWKAVLASRKCRVPLIDLPLYVSRRPRVRPNPYVAAVLNFFFLGLGYNYLGKWWGFLIFMSYMTLMLIFSLQVSTALPLFTIYPNLYSYPVTAIFAYQTYHMARGVPDL